MYLLNPLYYQSFWYTNLADMNLSCRQADTLGRDWAGRTRAPRAGPGRDSAGRTRAPRHSSRLPTRSNLFTFLCLAKIYKGCIEISIRTLSLRQGCGSGGILPGSNLRGKKTDPYPTSKKKPDPESPSKNRKLIRIQSLKDNPDPDPT